MALNKSLDDTLRTVSIRISISLLTRIEPLVHRFIHGAHAALTKLANDAVASL